MPSLTELQRLFAACLDGTADAGQTEAFHAALARGGSLSTAERVDVYRGTSREARLGTLETVYPVCGSILGRRCFRRLGSRYLDEWPSRSGDLNLYGEGFPTFIARRVRSDEQLASLPYLPDLARLERDWHSAYYARDEAPFDMEAFARASAGEAAAGIRFRLAADLRLLRSDYPIREIWLRHREGGDTGSVPAGEEERLVVRRDGFAAVVEPVSAAVFDLLAAVARGDGLGEMASGAVDIEPLPALIASGWIAGFVAPAEPLS